MLSQPKKILLISIALFLMVGSCCYLYGYQRHQAELEKRVDLEKTIGKYQFIEKTNLEFVGQRFPLDVRLPKRKSDFMLVYRFSRSCCSDCIHKGLYLMTKVLDKATGNEVLLIGDNQTMFSFKGQRSLTHGEELLNLDRINVPYFVLLDKNRVIQYVFPQLDYDESRMESFLNNVNRFYFQNPRKNVG